MTSTALTGAGRLVAQCRRWLSFLRFFSLSVSPQLKRYGSRGSPSGECCWSITMVLLRKPARLPMGCHCSNIFKRVSMLLLIGAQILAAVLFQSSIVLKCRGWPFRIMTSKGIMFGKSRWPALVVVCFQVGMFRDTLLSRFHPGGHMVSRRDRLNKVMSSPVVPFLLIRDTAWVCPSSLLSMASEVPLISVSWNRMHTRRA